MFKINFELEFGLSAGQKPNLNGSTVKSDECVPTANSLLNAILRYNSFLAIYYLLIN